MRSRIIYGDRSAAQGNVDATHVSWIDAKSCNVRQTEIIVRESLPSRSHVIRVVYAKSYSVVFRALGVGSEKNGESNFFFVFFCGTCLVRILQRGHHRRIRKTPVRPFQLRDVSKSGAKVARAVLGKDRKVADFFSWASLTSILNAPAIFVVPCVGAHPSNAIVLGLSWLYWCKSRPTNYQISLK